MVVGELGEGRWKFLKMIVYFRLVCVPQQIGLSRF